MPGRLFRRTDKKYDPERWQKRLATKNLQRVYDCLGWDGISGQWRQRTIDRLKQRILEVHASTGEPVTMLDVACFTGDYFGRLTQDRDVTPLLRYSGCDVTPKYIENAVKRWTGYDNARFTIGSALELPFGSSSFDIVFNSGMLIHIDDVQRCVYELARVAKRWILVETKVDPDLRADFQETHKSGRHFIDRVYRTSYIRGVIQGVATLAEEISEPYALKRQSKPVVGQSSTLFEAVPR